MPVAAPHPACAADDFLVTIPDQNLVVGIQRQLELKADEELRCSHLASMTTLVASGVTDLSGLEHAHRLSNLTVRASTVSSLAPIANLPRVTTLNFPGSQLTSLDLMANFPALVSIDVSNNPVSDQSPLANLPGLTFLAVAGNGITDITPLTDHAQLAWLELSGNQITDISALAGHTKLATLLLNDNMISDGSPLASATGLNRLEMANNELTNVDFMASIEPRSVNLAGNRISNINGVTRNAYLDGSRTVDLRNNCIDLASVGLRRRRALTRAVTSSCGLGSLGLAGFCATAWPLLGGTYATSVTLAPIDC